MASYYRAIMKAIQAAGFKPEEFEVHETGFEPNWRALGLAGQRFSHENARIVNRENRKVGKVAKSLVAAGHRATIYTAGHGGKFCEVNEYTHYGHTVDFNNPASVHHY